MFSNLSISRKLMGVFAVIGVIVAAMMLTIWQTSSTVQKATADAQRAQEIYGQAVAFEMAGHRMSSNVRGLVITSDPYYAENYEKGVKQIFEALNALDKLVDTDADHALIAQGRGLMEKWRQEWGVRTLAMVRAGHADQVMRLIRTHFESHQLSPSLKPIRVIRDREHDALATYAAAQQGAFATSRFALIAGALALILVVVGAWVLLSRSIAAPIGQMTGVMRRLAASDFSVTVEGTQRGDEIGAMAQAVEVFREAGIAKQQADAAKQRAEAEQRLVVESLETGLGKLAQGDLTAAITAEFSPSYQTVKHNFNEALESLRALIGAVSESAASIRTGASEIASASEDLARRTESNAASLEQTSAAVTQMDDRLKATAQAATKTVSRADGAIATVSGGRGIAEEAVQAMTRVADGAKGIDSVIEGLDKIAFQTRVLAMNAAVEAGRAGEAGRGFAVVADLVSALAMRSEEEAARAREQLTTTQTDIIAAVDMVQKVDVALVDISADVTEVHQLLGQMASDNYAQSSAISQISSAVGAMDQATQQNAAMVEETSAAARNLSTEVGVLADQSGRFNTGHGQMAGRYVKPATTPAARKLSPAPVKAAPVPAMAGGDDDWAAF